MEKEFVPYELALRLKELGFNEPCFGRWWFRADMHKLNEEELEILRSNYFELPEHYILAPLFQQAFRWFREKHSLQHEVYYLDDLIKNGYKITDALTNTELTEFQYKDNYFELRGYEFEEAELDCLKKLIEIIESK